MWSGPRNLSTALMYAFGNRGDCACWDEPFYACYLTQSGIDHPLRDEAIAAGEPDFRPGGRALPGAGARGKPVFYQKHMTHHMLPGFDRSWAFGLTNAFLIRSPERVLASYARKRQGVTLRDIGFVEQCEIFDMVADRLGAAPPSRRCRRSPGRSAPHPGPPVRRSRHPLQRGDAELAGGPAAL
jgi:hypothetical protein